MKVTVFTSCYNQGQYLPEAIESVLCQTHTDIEYLLIDDGSTDNTKQIIQNYAKKDSRIIPIYLNKYPNIATVINYSISIMKSDIWVWVPSDDIIHNNLIEKKIEKLTSNNIILAWGDIINSDGKFQSKISFNWNSSDEFKKRIWEDCFIGMTGIMIPISVFKKIGTFPEHMLFSEDFYWILKSTKFDIDYDYIPEVLYKKRIHNGRTTNKYYNAIIKNIPIIKEEIKRIYGN
jgi:glycosyltransferase involved in cell wall biosynthesis